MDVGILVLCIADSQPKLKEHKNNLKYYYGTFSTVKGKPIKTHLKFQMNDYLKPVKAYLIFNHDDDV